MAEGDLVKVVFKPGGEVVVHVLREVLGQEAVDDAANVGRDEAFAVHLDVLAVLERRDDARVRRWPTDAVLLERLDEACLRKARRRLGEVLFGTQLVEPDRVALDNLRQQTIPVVVLGVVFAFLVDGHEPGLDQHRAVGAQTMSGLFRSRGHLDGYSVEHGRHHLAGHRAFPDQ